MQLYGYKQALDEIKNKCLKYQTCRIILKEDILDIIKKEKRKNPMLVFNLKKEWFDKIKSGEKTHEYRVVKDYWFKRLFLYSKKLCRQTTIPLHSECVFVCGYAPKEDLTKRLKAKIESISIVNGKNTDLKIDGDVFDIEFELIKDGE